MDHRKARERAWVVFIFAAVVLAGGRAYGNPVMIRTITIFSGPISFFLISLCIMIEYLFLQKIQGFNRRRSIIAALLMNFVSALPGHFYPFSLAFFYPYTLVVDITNYFQKIFEVPLNGHILWLDFPGGPWSYALVLSILISFLAMLALDVLIEGAVLRIVLKMHLIRRNLFILTATNLLTLALLYSVIIYDNILNGLS